MRWLSEHCVGQDEIQRCSRLVMCHSNSGPEQFSESGQRMRARVGGRSSAHLSGCAFIFSILSWDRQRRIELRALAHFSRTGAGDHYGADFLLCDCGKFHSNTLPVKCREGIEVIAVKMSMLYCSPANRHPLLSRRISQNVYTRDT